MLRQTIRWAAVAALLFGAVSCSKDETPGDPEGTVLLNMYNEQNGKTLLSDSDIYINDAGNFISPASCQLFMLGERSGRTNCQRCHYFTGNECKFVRYAS